MENNQTKEKLLAEIDRLKKELKKKKKFGLVWEDKSEDVVEMCKEKLPVLKEVKSKEIITDKTKQVNLLIEGDNYHALSVLNYTHKGKIDFIYIDPPYNTGAKDWKYNNDYVDSEDAYRHSKWLSFMGKRLELSRKLLERDGVLCCTIDDYEIFSLLGLFNVLNATILGIVCIVNKAEGRNQKKYFTGGFEYAVFVTWGNPDLRGLDKSVSNECSECGKKINKDKSNKISENGKSFSWVGFHRRNPIENPEESSRWYPLFVSKDNQISLDKKTGWQIVFPINSKGEKKIWGWKKDRLADFLKSHPNEFKVERTKTNGIERIKILHKRYETEKVKPKSYWIGSKYNAYSYGTKLLKEVLETNKTLFDFPKSLYAVIDCIDLFLPEDGVVLDFFAGSGTTGHAVLELNEKDDGNRKFILCTNNENNICEGVTFPRIEKVIEGYKNLKGQKVAGLGGNLKYFKTDFVDYKESTDRNKIKLTKEAVEMLCVKEGTFESVLNNEDFKIFKNHDHYTGIIFDQLAIEDFKKAVKGIKGKTSVYIFSLGDDSFEDEFEDIKQKVKLSPIPEAILKVYRRIYK